MSFLSPLFLLLGGAAAVPLLLHLMRRRTGREVEFPAVRYLVRAEREHSRRLRLRNLLLMLLRVAAVLLIALAAAGPFARIGGPGHPPTALAIVLDNSLSTTVVVDDRATFERLRDAARAAVASTTDADRVWLLTADGAVTGGTRAAIRSAIDAARPLEGAGRLDEALARAAELTRSAAPLAPVVALATDGQATQLPRARSLGAVNVRVLVPPTPPVTDRYVASAEAVPSTWTPGGTLRFRVGRSGVARTDSVTYRVLLGQRTLARGTASAGGSDVTIRASPAERGWLSGAVELEPDELRGDDRRVFAVFVGPPPVASAEPSAGPFVSSALATLVQDARVRVASGGVQITGADAVTRRPALVFAPGDPVLLGAANRSLERAGIPWRFGAARVGVASVRVRDLPGTGASDATGAAAGDISVSKRWALQPTGSVGSADTLAAVGGEPWIVAGDGYVVVGSPMTPEATTFPLRAAFVPWLGAVIAQRLSGAGGGVVHASPGSRLARPAWADAIETETGGVSSLSASDFSAPQRVGVYFFRRSGSRVGALVVNAEAEESELVYLSRDDMRGRIRARDVDVSTSPSDWRGSLFRASGGRPLAAMLLLLAILMLVAEGIASRAASAPLAVRAS
jgi:hypothetical protein